MRWLCAGDFFAAFLINPLIFFSLIGIAFYDAYAAIVLIFRLPRLRLDELSSRTANLFRGGAAAVLLLNWGWLIAWGI